MNGFSQAHMSWFQHTTDCNSDVLERDLDLEYGQDLKGRNFQV